MMERPEGRQSRSKAVWGRMFARILVAIDGFGQHPAALDLVKSVATDGTTQVRVLHLRLREVSGFSWYARETGSEAAFVADAAVFDLRMAGLAAGGDVRYAAVDRVAEAILAEARAFNADLIVLGRPRRGEVLTRLLGSVTLRIIRRSTCPVIVAPRRRGRPDQAVVSPASAPGRRS
jgi:nucleotide-binding universal stress UspA family protein